MPLSLTARIFIVYGVFVALTAWFVLRLVNDQIKPAVRQSTEETLVDTANLLAELIGTEIRSGALPAEELASILARYNTRHPQADIWGLEKNTVSHRIYITDQRGIVLFDSSGVAVGEDYSRWNDVYLTLRGQYGARSSPEDPDDPDSTVMHVAAPIRDGQSIVGVLTVAKPNRSLQPYIERSEQELAFYGGGLLLLGIGFAAVLSWRFGRTLRLLTRYAAAVSRGERQEVPQPAAPDLRQLADAIENMRVQLEGKAYVERYVETLTHELKSPLAAIRGAAELLEGEMPVTDRQRFLHNIRSQTERLQDLSERLLGLAMLEQQRAPVALETVNLQALVDELVSDIQPRLAAGAITTHIEFPQALQIPAERFLLQQAITNLLDNAVRWTPRKGNLRLTATRQDRHCEIRVENTGPCIPDYALPRLTERFYSLPDPVSGQKGTGLGLNFVLEVALLHHGGFRIENTADGVVSILVLPLDPHAKPTLAPHQTHT
jgi:two-component system sensor histidine kinase CreC